MKKMRNSISFFLILALVLELVAVPFCGTAAVYANGIITPGEKSSVFRTQKSGKAEAEQTKTPDEGEMKTPDEGETKTPDEGETKTPGEGGTNTPDKGEPDTSNPGKPGVPDTDTGIKKPDTDADGAKKPKPDTSAKPETSVNQILITADSKKIAAGKKIALTAKVLPADASNKQVTWSLDNSNYASVDTNGVVTAKKAGAGKTVTITAAAKDGSGVKGTYEIQIVKHIVKKITLTADATAAKYGDKLKIKAKVAVSGKTANKSLKWSSDQEEYATVNEKGVVTILKQGKGEIVTITAAATDGSGIKATYQIKIKRALVTGIMLTANTLTVKAGNKLNIKATVYVSSRNASRKLKWTTSNSKYATVSKKGVLKAKKAGKGKTVKITAAATDGSGKKGTIQIKIK